MAEIDPVPEPTLAASFPDDPGLCENGTAELDDEPVLNTNPDPGDETSDDIDYSAHVPPDGNRDNSTAKLSEASSILGAVQGLGERLSGRLDALQTTFDRELRAEATRERVIDRLHAELQEYKQDFLLKVQRPIFIDLIQLHDDIGKMVEFRPGSDADPERNQAVRAVVESVQTAIEDILYRQGVEPFVTEGDEFDPRRQRAVSTQLTDDPARNKRVASRLRKGFQAADKLIRPEVVTVFTYRPPVPAAET
jgi:molecular chaperone GrpE